LKTKEEVEAIEAEHFKAPHLRILQKELAKEITIRVHSEQDFNAAVEASEILFGKGTEESLNNLSENDLLSIFEGVPQVSISKDEIAAGINIIEFLSDKTQIFPSRGEARKMLQGGGVLINKSKIEDPELKVTSAHLMKEKYLLAQKGKKNYYLVTVG
jgi:tyrosyl-tRNA synthetase